MKNKLKLLAVLMVAYWSSWAQFVPSYIEYNPDNETEYYFDFNYRTYVRNDNVIRFQNLFAYNNVQNMPVMDSILINRQGSIYKYLYEYNTDNKIIKIAEILNNAQRDIKYHYEDDLITKIETDNYDNLNYLLEYSYNTNNNISKIEFSNISTNESTVVAKKNYYYNSNGDLIKIETDGFKHQPNVYIDYYDDNRIKKMRSVKAMENTDFIINEEISTYDLVDFLPNNYNTLSVIRTDTSITINNYIILHERLNSDTVILKYSFLDSIFLEVKTALKDNFIISTREYSYSENGYTILGEGYNIKLVYTEDSVFYLKENLLTRYSLEFNNDKELIRYTDIGDKVYSFKIENGVMIENDNVEMQLYPTLYPTTYNYSSENPELLINDTTFVLMSSTQLDIDNYNLSNMFHNMRVRTFNENGDILTYKVNDYEISYYYQTAPLAKKISLDGNKLIVEFNYNLDIEADMMDYIQFNTELTKSDVELLRILSVSVSESNNKLLIIEFNRNIEVGEVFALESATGLPLRDGRMAPLSIKTADLTEIAENNNASELQVSINCNSVIATNTVGIEKVEVYTNTGIQLMSYPAKGNNKVEVKLPRAVSDMLIISVTESGGNVQSFKSVCE